MLDVLNIGVREGLPKDIRDLLFHYVPVLSCFFFKFVRYYNLIKYF